MNESKDFNAKLDDIFYLCMEKDKDLTTIALEKLNIYEWLPEIFKSLSTLNLVAGYCKISANNALYDLVHTYIVYFYEPKNIA